MNLIITQEMIRTLPRYENPFLAALKPALPAGVQARQEYDELYLFTDGVEFCYDMPGELMTWLMAWYDGVILDPIHWEVPCCPDDLQRLIATSGVSYDQACEERSYGEDDAGL